MRTLRDLADLGDRLAATPSKLAKAQLIAESLRTASPENTLRLAVRYLGGRVFGVTDGRTVGVRSAILRDALIQATGLSPAEWRREVIAAGESGEALARVHGRFPATPATTPLTLDELAAAFDDLAAVSTVAGRRNRLAGLLIRAASDGPRPLAYVGKILSGDLRIGVAEGVLLDAAAEAFGVSRAAARAGLRAMGDVAEVAVLAAGDGEAALFNAPFTLFRPVTFMLAAVALSPAELAGRVTGPALLEDKLDGIRVQAHKSGDGSSARVELYTRTLDRVTESFPDVVTQVAQVPGEFILDGEVVAMGASGEVAPFARLQARLNRRKLTPEMLRSAPAGFVPFDLLYRDGAVLMDEPLITRRASLDALLAGSSLSPLPAEPLEPGVTEAELASRFAEARARRNEGLMLKLLASPYTPGRRGGVWYKLKGHLPTLDCVVVQAEVGHGKRRGVLSDYTFAVRSTPEPDSPLLTLGKAYSGLTDREIAELTVRFREAATASDGRRFTVPPEVVLEIAFDAIQRSDRHDSGFALRFPRIVRWRKDKPVADISTLDEVRQIHDSTDNLNRAEPVPPSPPRQSPSAQLSLFADP